MKYIIDVSRDRVSKNGKLQLLCEIEDSLPQYVHTAIDAEPYKESSRKAIEDEVWKLADTIHGMSIQDKMSCFGFSLTSAVTSNLSYQEAKSKYEAWFKQKDEIRVGDEVNPINDTWRGVVVNVDNGDLTIMGSSGIFANGYESKYFSKTGRHFPEVAQLLDKMRGEEQ